MAAPLHEMGMTVMVLTFRAASAQRAGPSEGSVAASAMKTVCPVWSARRSSG